MISKNHLRLLLKETFDNSTASLVAEHLLEMDSCSLHTLYQYVKPQVDIKQFQIVLGLMVKRGLIKATGGTVELNHDSVTILLFKNVIVNFVTRRFGEYKGWIVAYLIQVNVSGYRQAFFDLMRWAKYNKKEADREILEKHLDELIRDNVIINDNEEAASGDFSNTKRLIKLNNNRLYALVRAEFCAEFLKDSSRKATQVISIILKHSALYNKSAFVQNTEKFPIDRLKELCILEAPELVQQGNLEAGLKSVCSDYISIDGDGVAVKLEKLVENMKIEVIENYIRDTLGTFHLRVFRGLILLHLTSEKEIEEQLLVKRTDYRQALLDLEKHSAIVRTEGKDDKLPYKPNVEEFTELLTKRLTKVLENLEVLKVDCQNKWGHRQDREIQDIKLDVSINLILKRLLILAVF